MASSADPCTAYARDVVAGKVVAGRLVRLACERHLRDLETGAARGLKWDREVPSKALRFFGALRLADGRPFQLEPFQAFLTGCLFGWKNDDGSRRFRVGYIEIGKGNGKTPWAAAVGLYGLVADREPAAEVYAAATTADQAMILYRDARRMAEDSPALARHLDLSNKTSMAYGHSFFRPLSGEHRTKSGPRPHMALVDEVHEHPDAQVWDKMRAGTKGRRQALVIGITNSGWDRSSVCWHLHDYSAAVLEGRVENDSWFAYVCGLDPCADHQAEGKQQPVEGCAACDDWREEKNWPKANPGLGSILPAKYLREQVEEAKGIPTKEGIVRRLNFCYWTEGETLWLPVDLWAKGAGTVDAEGLRGKECWGGLDIASKIDVAAFALTFPDEPAVGHYTFLWRFWIPRAGAQARAVADGVPWLVWERQGWVKLTEGNSIDPDTIEQDVMDLFGKYAIQQLAYDPWNATQMALHLKEFGIEVVEFPQNLKNFNEPSKTFESGLKDGKVHHDNNPVATWMAGNVAVITDRSGNIRPVKPDHNSPKKVDGIIAAVMALGQSLTRPASPTGTFEAW